jgi:hypothetical protein
LVPLVHRINGFGQLSAAALVDTACIYPSVAESRFASQGTGHSNLVITLLAFESAADIVLVCHFFQVPSVRQYRIRENVASHELFELSSTGVNEPHVKCI